jgi:pimeloyl-ACP methyl ester carboxylesterase
MDVNRFQRWFFYYSTGLPLETVSALIYEKLSQLHAVYRFPRLCIVAHSMGGLVVRSFLNRYALQSPPYEVMLFISMSTPWGGVKRAELAPRPGESLFKSPPVWKDLVPGSSFLKKLHSQCLPRSVRYYLIFGDKRPSPLVTEAGDGVIRLDSQLHPEARAEAEGVFGFHEDHSGILRSEAALERYRDILSSVTPSGSCR